MMGVLESEIFAFIDRISLWGLVPDLVWAARTLVHLKQMVMALRAEADQCAIAYSSPPTLSSLRDR